MDASLVLAIALTTLSAGQTPVDPDEFRDKYVRDFETIAQQLQNVKGTFLLTIKTKDQTGKVLRSAQDSGNFEVTGNLGKCIRNVVRTVGNKTKEVQLVHGQTADSYFTLSKNIGETKFTLENYSPLPKQGEIPIEPIEYRIFCGSL